jgi:hypothetical protein
MGALDDYLDALPSADVSALLSPEIHAFEASVYTNPLIYKYYGVGRRSFFECPQLRFSQREALNDPLEMSRRWKTISTEGLRSHLRNDLREKLPSILSNPNLLLKIFQEKAAKDGVNLTFAMITHAQQQLRSAAGKRSLAKQLIDMQGSLDSAVDHVFSMLETQFDLLADSVIARFGVLSLTEDALSEQMWAHYATGGHGFVIGFDAHHQFFLSKDGTKNLLRKVHYTDERTENFWNNPYFLFLVKGSRWSSEREWRMLKNLSERDVQDVSITPPVCLWNVPPEAIKMVSFGYNYDSSYLSHDMSKLAGCGVAASYYLTRVNRDSGTIGLSLIAS